MTFMAPRRAFGPSGRFSFVAGLVAFCAAFLLGAPGSWAKEVFTIYEVEVDVTAASAREARAEALAEGRVIAFRRLIERLTPREEWSRLPELNASDLLAYEAGFEVTREKASSVRYIADITYSFDPGEVRAFMRRNAVSYSENQAPPALVLAVLDAAEGLVLWDEGNAWAAAWGAGRHGAELLPVRLPLGDATDIIAITAERAVSATWAELAPLASRYGTKDVIVAFARYSEPGPGEAPSLDVRLTRIGETTYEVSEAGVTGAPGAGAQGLSQDLALQGIEAAMGPWREEWKRRTLVAYGTQSVIDVTARFPRGLLDWTEMRGALGRVPNVLKTEVQSLSGTGAELRLTVAGTIDQLRTALREADLRFEAGPDHWLLQTAAAGPLPPGFVPGAGGQQVTVLGPDPSVYGEPEGVPGTALDEEGKTVMEPVIDPLPEDGAAAEPFGEAAEPALVP